LFCFFAIIKSILSVFTPHSASPAPHHCREKHAANRVDVATDDPTGVVDAISLEAPRRRRRRERSSQGRRAKAMDG